MRGSVCKIRCPSSFSFCNPFRSSCRGEELKKLEEEEKKKSISKPVACSRGSVAVDDVDRGLQSCLRSGEVTEKKKVQWMDSTGKPLFDIREFEPSDSETDDESEMDEEMMNSSLICSIL